MIDNPLEKDIEQAACRWGRYREIYNIKLTGYKGIQDRLFWGDGKGMLVIEFKRPGTGRLSAAQKWWRKRMGSNAHVVDNIEDAKRILKRLIPDSWYIARGRLPNQKEA